MSKKFKIGDTVYYHTFDHIQFNSGILVGYKSNLGELSPTHLIIDLGDGVTIDIWERQAKTETELRDYLKLKASEGNTAAAMLYKLNKLTGIE